MGMLFVLIFWAIALIILSLILGLITLPFSYFLCKRQKEEEDGSIIPHTRSIYRDIRCK